MNPVVYELQKRIQLGIADGASEDARFMDVVCGAVSGELEANAAGEVFMIRIDNWFDHKWLNFAGIGGVSFDGKTNISQIPDNSLDEFRQVRKTVKKTFPPFSPDRVMEELCYRRGENGAYSLDPNAPRIHSKVRARSSGNLHRRVADFSDSALFAWFSAKTRINGRGSLMVYRADAGAVTSWYAAFSKEAEWSVLRTEGISREKLQTWIARSK